MPDADAIGRDLKPLVRGDLHFDLPHRVLYRTAACLFEQLPLGVVTPADEESVATLLRYCRDRAIPITARGAGTGVAGQTVGRGIVVDFTRHLDDIVEIDPGRRRVRVQPGATLRSVNEALAKHGLTVGVDPSSGAVCTIGGMIANNAAGIHTPLYGAMRDVVKSMRWLPDDGRAERIADIRRDLASYWPELREAARADRPDSLKNSSGYHVYGDRADADALLIGSEGTLGVVIEAELEVFRAPEDRTLVRLGFDDLEAAAAAVLDLRPMKPAAVEMLDRTVAELVPDLVPPGAKYLLLCEFFGKDAAKRAKGTKSVRGAVSREAAGTEERPKLWKARKAISPLLERVPGGTRSTRLIEDIAVSPERLGEFVKGLHGIFERHGVRGVVFGHAADGHLHVNLLIDPKAPDAPERQERIAADGAALAKRLRGTLSGEHGDGLLRAPYLRTMFPNLYPHFERIKRIFDPSNVLNPGKKVAPAEYSFARDLRAARRPGRERHALDQCNGCGHCLAYCPAYAADPRIQNLPRGISDARTAALDGLITAGEAG